MGIDELEMENQVQMYVDQLQNIARRPERAERVQVVEQQPPQLRERRRGRVSRAQVKQYMETKVPTVNFESKLQESSLDNLVGTECSIDNLIEACGICLTEFIQDEPVKVLKCSSDQTQGHHVFHQ